MKKKKMKHIKKSSPLIVVTTGGSGGHIFPAESISSALIKKGARVVFITDKRGKAFHSLPGVKTYHLLSEAIARRSIFQKTMGLIKLFLGAMQAMVLLHKLKPDLVVGVGGYASFPAGMAASMLKIPLVLHEQNAVLGRANRILSKNANIIATSFAPTKFLPSAVPNIRLGMPVRAQVIKKAGAPYKMVAEKDDFNLLIFGGSQGASFFSHGLVESLLLLPNDIKSRLIITHQARNEDIPFLQSQYQRQNFKNIIIKPFFDNMPDLMVQSQLVIGRGGASTIAELELIGRPAIIVPLPTSVDNHQEENAKQFCNAGAGWLVKEGAFDAAALSNRLQSLILKPDVLKDAAFCAHELAKINASDLIASEIFKVINK